MAEIKQTLKTLLLPVNSQITGEQTTNIDELNSIVRRNESLVWWQIIRVCISAGVAFLGLVKEGQTAELMAVTGGTFLVLGAIDLIRSLSRAGPIKEKQRELVTQWYKDRWPGLAA
ncbi:MAG: hypothetical protein Q7S31_02415 [bacterium]|nr:hypothetical protein [bacterium]